MIKGLALAALLVAGAGVAVAPVIGTIYADAHPADPQKRQALELCAALNRSFDRLLAAERADCYRRILAAPPVAPMPSLQTRPLRPPSQNFADRQPADDAGLFAHAPLDPEKTMRAVRSLV